MLKWYTVELTKPEIDHLLCLLLDKIKDGSYYGPREQYYKRSQRVLERLHDALRGPSAK